MIRVTGPRTQVRRMLPLVLLVLLAACDRGEPGRIEAPARSPDIVVSLPSPSAGTLDYPARVLAEETAEIATRVSAAVLRVNVDEGTEVGPGDVLVVLDGSTIEAEISRARAAARAARRYFERISSLERDGAATGQELDDARARLDAAEAASSAAAGQRAYTRLRAPFAGVIAQRRVDPGDLAVPGRPVLVLSGLTGVKIVADLPAAAAGLVPPGRRVNVVDPGRGVRRPAAITRLVPVVDASSQRVRVEARFTALAEGTVESSPSPAFVPGSYVRLEVSEAEEESSWIPADAIWRTGQLTGAFVLEADTLRLRWLRLGQIREDAAEVLSGIRPDLPVVRRPPASLRDGMPAGTVRREAWRARGGEGSS